MFPFRFLSWRVLPVLVLLFAGTWRATGDVSISEFLASNSNSIRDEDGEHEDWIEVFNSGPTAVNLLGWYLTDDPTQLRRWAFPSKTLDAGAYLVVFASDKDRRNPAANLHTNFKLSASPGYLALTRDIAGGGVEVVTAFTYPRQATDLSYGTSSVVTTTPLIAAAAPVKALVPTSPALGATWREPTFDDSGWLAGTTGVGFGDSSAPVAPANLKQRLNSDSAAAIVADTSGAAHPGTNAGATWVQSNTDTFTQPRTRTGVMQFVAAENDQVTTPGHADFTQAQCTVTFWMRSAGTTGAGSEAAMLWDRRTGTGVGVGTVITQHTNGRLFFQAGGPGVRCSFSSNTPVSDNRWHHVAVVINTAAGATNTFYVDGLSSGSGTNSQVWGWTPTTPIELGRSHDPYWMRYNGLLDDVRFYNRHLTPEEIALLAAAGDDATRPEDIGLNVQAAMENVNATAYLRVPFNVSNPNDFASLRLSQRWNDGFLAYVNGTQITAQNAPAAPEWNSTATAAHGGSVTDTYNFSLPAGLLRTGANVLAIQGLNVAAADPSFLMLPKLDGQSAPVTGSGYTTAPTPGAANSSLKLNVGPFVSQVTNNPNPRPLGDASSPDLVITARVDPSLRPLAATDPVQLKYVIMFGTEQTVNMTLTATPGVYTASIPTNTLTPGQMLRWRVVATDDAGAIGTGPQFSDAADNEQYYGTVAVDPSIQTNLPVLYWFIQSTTALDGSDTPTRCSLFYKAFGDTGVGRFYDNVLVDRHGQSSSGFPKKSYNFDFNEDNRFEWDVAQERTKDMDLLTNWGDKAKVRNKMTHEAFATVGSVHHWTHQVRVQQVTPANQANPAAQFFSIADMMEDGDEDFIARNGRDPNGALYKIYDSLAGSGSAEKKTRLFENKSDLDALITGLNVGLPIGTRRSFAYANLDVPQCVSYFVGCILASHQDHGHKNYYVYRDTLGTGEWSILPWDVDLSWGRNWQDSPGYFTDTIFTNNDLDMYNSAMQGKGENRLYSLFVGNSDVARVPAPDFRDMVLRRLRTVLDGYFSVPGLLENRFLALADLMDPPAIASSDADKDRAKWGTWGNDGGNTVGGAAMRYHINQIINLYLPGRRTFLNTAAIAGTVVPPSQPANVSDLITIETVDFNPTTGNQDHEYFVLRNSNSVAVDVSGWQITGAVDWTFKPGTVIPPGGGVTEHVGDLFVAKNPLAFRQGATVAGGRAFCFVQGPYHGQLSARGETIELRDGAGTLLKTRNWAPAPSAMQNQLRITEINYAPVEPTPAEEAALPGVGESDFEYLELINIGAAPLVLTGAHFGEGIDFTFPNFTLAPGARCLLVANLAAFQLRYGNGLNAQIVGAYEGQLDNNGETIQLLDAVGEVILDFRYDDDWFPPSNEGGRTLVLRFDGIDWSLYDLPVSWALSGNAGGTPGTGDSDFANVYEGWRHDHFTPAEQSVPGVAGPNVDPEGDGLINWAEYVFGRDPRAQDHSALTTFSIVSVGGVDYPAITFTRRHKALDATFNVEASSNLINWSPITEIVGAPQDLGAGLERVTYRDSQAAGSGPRFLRVRAVR